MRYTILSFFVFLVVCALAQTPPLKAVMVSYKQDTPDSILDQAKDAIRQAGGVVTHDFKLIKGFAANAPAEVLNSVQAWGTEHEATIEEDQIVHALGGPS
ncbi:hypothetical protein EV356DRAFT_578647 [Viridothelium virens]|uniref:Inhibitor I9 domain-containing protein n=1 Tax=Viridothelium virens TaxID=1048519 RepID=A0A6A6H263_VIRVR|nr:hypothetical protein EV356DRAFT_578647 [Viridothelium virens]